VTPADLKLNVGKIVVTPDNIESLDNGYRTLDFQLGKYWRYYSTSPFHYNFELGSITAATGYVSTGQVDVPVELIKIKYDKLYITQLDNIDQLTLAGIKDLPISDAATIIFSKGNSNVGWKLTVHERDTAGNYDHDAIVARLDGLPHPFMPDDYIDIQAIELNSENQDMHLNLSGSVRPFDICDFTVQSITTGDGYFILNGSSLLGRDNVRVHGLASSFMGIQFDGPKNNITGKIVSSYQGAFETKGGVHCALDPNTVSQHKQHFRDKKFYSTTRMRIYEEGKGEFFLNGVLEVDYNYVKLHIIDADLNITDVQYTDADQSIRFQQGTGKMMVRRGVQLANADEWEFLEFDANLVDFNGINGNQPPMNFVVTGAVSAVNTRLEVENIEIAGGLAEIELTFDFEKQELYGSLDFTPPTPIQMGPVAVTYINAQILAGPSGFIFGGRLDGTIAAVFPARLGILLGSHNAIPGGMIDNVMHFTKFPTPPPSIADGSLSGFFITAQVHLIHAPMDTFDFGVGYIAGGAEVGFDAQVYMDFDAQGFAFGFGALAYAEVMAAADSWMSPCGICLSASLQLQLTGEIREVGNDWDVSGTGCGSLLFTLAICGVPVDDIGGKCDITFSSLNGTDVSAEFGESCSNNPAGGFDCTEDE
jgi:hypothetical protein